MFSKTSMLAQIALRNLLASPINLIIGALILFGTVFFVVFGSLLDTLGESMSKSVIGSVAGHIQIYSSKSKDELSLYGSMGGDPDLTAITDFSRIKTAIEAVPNVKTVVPMGVAGALITSGNTVDMTLEKLRDTYKARDGKATHLEMGQLTAEGYAEQIQNHKDHIRQMVKVLQDDSEKQKVMLDEARLDVDAQAALKKVSSDEFWQQFDVDPYASLEFLENKVAPQVSDANLLFLRYVGTDLDAFQKSFDRMQITQGQPVPKGQRGFLIAKYIYEEQLKLKNARRLDKIKEGRAVGKLIASDPDLTRYVKENTQQTRDIVLQLDAIKTRTATERVQKFLGSPETDLSKLLSTFFATTDDDFDARYTFFYEQLVPLVELYRVRIGDTLTIKAFTRAGYVKSVSVKVYGVFSFTGIEKSPLAGAVSLMDLMSFRDLYGYLTTDNLDELKSIQAETGAKKVDREHAEEDLFGGDAKVVEAQATAGVIDEGKELSGTARKLRQEDLIRRVYEQKEIESGVVLNAAVILKDPTRIKETIEEINRVSAAEKLDLKAVSWQQAAGILGQMIGVFKGILVGFVLIIFGVAMIVIYNAMLMATLQRTQMIGTMRAIGAQRGFVLNMVLTESVVLGIVFGIGGMVVGSGVVGLIASKGIPAFNDYAYFFFSGPRLIPTLSMSNLVVALILVLVATTLSTLIPAIIATRVSPLRAMQSDE